MTHDEQRKDTEIRKKTKHTHMSTACARARQMNAVDVCRSE